MIPLKPIGITRTELGLDPDLDNARFVLFPSFFLPPLLLLFIAAVSTRWHQPTGTVLHAELGWGGEDDLVKGSLRKQLWQSGLEKQQWLSWI